MTQSMGEDEVYFISQLSGHSLSLREGGQELKQTPWGTLLTGSISWFTQGNQDHCPGVTLPSMGKKMTQRLDYRPIQSEEGNSQLRFPFPKCLGLCQVGKNQLSHVRTHTHTSLKIIKTGVWWHMPSTWEVNANRSLWFWGQPILNRKFQVSQGYIVGATSKQTNKQKTAVTAIIIA